MLVVLVEYSTIGRCRYQPMKTHPYGLFVTGLSVMAGFLDRRLTAINSDTIRCFLACPLLMGICGIDIAGQRSLSVFPETLVPQSRAPDELIVNGDTQTAGCRKVISNSDATFTSSDKVPIAACTQEAMQCPNGQFVTRIGPNCEFAPCPSTCTPQPPPTTSCPNGSSWNFVPSDSICHGTWKCMIKF
jgi:hypothetical protein